MRNQGQSNSSQDQGALDQQHFELIWGLFTEQHPDQASSELKAQARQLYFEEVSSTPNMDSNELQTKITALWESELIGEGAPQKVAGI